MYPYNSNWQPSTPHSSHPTSNSQPFRPDGTLDPEYQRRIAQNNAPPSRSVQVHQFQSSYPYNQYPPPPSHLPTSYHQNPPPHLPPPPQYHHSHQQPHQPTHSYPPPQTHHHQQQQQQQPYLPTPHDPQGSSSGMMSRFRPSGRKKALLVGINYKGTPAELKGCVRDVTFIHHLLTSKFGFRNQDFVVLTDERSGISGVRTGMPTKKVILDSIKWLISESRPGDSLWFSFSGHGSQVRDSSGDESDGYDETILPVNYKTAGHIVDDQLYEIVKRVCRGARLTVLLDACHSGTGKSFNTFHIHSLCLKQLKSCQLTMYSFNLSFFSFFIFYSKQVWIFHINMMYLVQVVDKKLIQVDLQV